MWRTVTCFTSLRMAGPPHSTLQDTIRAARRSMRVSSCVTGGECLHSSIRTSFPKVTGAARADCVTGAPTLHSPPSAALLGPASSFTRSLLAAALAAGAPGWASVDRHLTRLHRLEIVAQIGRAVGALPQQPRRVLPKVLRQIVDRGEREGSAFQDETRRFRVSPEGRARERHGREARTRFRPPAMRSTVHVVHAARSAHKAAAGQAGHRARPGVLVVRGSLPRPRKWHAVHTTVMQVDVATVRPPRGRTAPPAVRAHRRRRRRAACCAAVRA
jgi:hypothetical protein